MKTNWFFTLFLSLIVLSSQAQLEETEQQKSMAKQMASYMDMAWDADPEDNTANLRILMQKDGRPMEGIVSIHGRFRIIIRGRTNHSSAYNPNKNGRFVYEGIAPGTYQVEITGQYEMEGFSWTKEMTFSAGDSPLVTIDYK